MITAIPFRADCVFGKKNADEIMRCAGREEDNCCAIIRSGLGAPLLKKMLRIPQYRWKLEAGTNI